MYDNTKHPKSNSDIELQDLKADIQGRPSYRAEVKQDRCSNGTFRDELAMIDGVVIKGRNIVKKHSYIPKHWSNGIATTWVYKMWLPPQDSLYWFTMSADIEDAVKN